MPIFCFIGCILPELFEKTGKLWKIYKQTKESFYTSTMCVSNLLKVHTSAGASVVAVSNVLFEFEDKEMWSWKCSGSFNSALITFQKTKNVLFGSMKAI